MEGIGLIFIIYILTSGYLEISLLFIKEVFNIISQNIDKLDEAKNNFIQIILNINYKSISYNTYKYDKKIFFYKYFFIGL